VGYFWRGRDIFQGETNKVVSLEVLPVKQPEFKVFGRNVDDRMKAQRDTRVALHHARMD
jgi:hypothetical protein